MKYHFLQMYIKRNQAWKNNGKRGCGCCSTFVIGPDGTIEKIFDKVNTKDHFKQIVEAYQ